MRAIWALFLLVATASGINNPLESRLDRQMRVWQKRLGLEEWKISLRVVRQAQMGLDAWGTSEWDDEKKVATLNVLDPRDYNLRGDELRLDMECTIVHELVHIQVSPLEARDGTVREEVVNKIMTALVNRPCPN